MKKLNITISKAQIVSFSVELQEDKPKVSATIALLTAGDNVISTYGISTDAWNDKNKFELPVSMVGPILEIMHDLEPIVVKHCMGEHLRLKTGNVDA